MPLWVRHISVPFATSVTVKALFHLDRPCHWHNIHTHTHRQTGTFASKSVRVRLTRLSLGKWGMLSEITQCWSLTKKNGKPLSSPHCHWGCDLHRVVASCSLLFDELVRSLSILFFGTFGLLRHISYHRLSLVHDGTLTNYSMRVRDYAPRTLLTL